MRKWTTQRENADSGSVLSIPMIVRNPDPVEPELVYGDHFHCPSCNAGYPLVETVDPADPWHICALCAQVVDLRAYAKRVPNPYVEHGPGVQPAA